MERAALRPVPTRPSGPVDPAAAVAHVGAALPFLDAEAARALALVEIAGSARPHVAAEIGIDAERLAEALARARKALRRASFPLSASGWCERAERLISDRLDGELEPPGPARLDVHLRNCGRCVEHERRLYQARESLVTAFIGAQPAPAPELRIVAETQVEPDTVSEPAAPAKPPAQAPRPTRPRKEPQPQRAAALERGAASVTAPASQPSGRSSMATTVLWGALFGLAVLLAVASILIAVLGAAGAGA
jgi:putative zinc finger protein